MASIRPLVALGVVCTLFAATFLAGPLLQLGATPGLVALVVVGAALLAVGLAYRRRRESDGGSRSGTTSRRGSTPAGTSSRAG